jgi:hypothetical protein
MFRQFSILILNSRVLGYFVVALILAMISPAGALEILPTLPITTAVTATVTPMYQLRPGPGGQLLTTNMSLQATFTYGSGGTSADAYVQTSIDGGNTWIDVANFHFTTSSARYIYNLFSGTPVTTEYTPTDGSLSSNTAKDGQFGNFWRVKYVTVGTYAGGTTLRVDAIANGLTTLP